MNTGCRIARVRLKDGPTVHILPSPEEASRARCLKSIRNTIDKAGDIAGFAFVAWDPQGASICTFNVTRSNIPSILVPDFVRNRLLAERISSWTIEDVNEQWGGPPSDC